MPGGSSACTAALRLCLCTQERGRVHRRRPPAALPQLNFTPPCVAQKPPVRPVFRVSLDPPQSAVTDAGR
jgi:hypothetical protein